MAYRKRAQYGDEVPAALRKARSEYDAARKDADRLLVKARARWMEALAEAVEAGMSYEEVVALVGVSHSSIAKAVREKKK